MSTIEDFDVSGFIKDGELMLENLRIENSRIVGLELHNVRLVSITNCVLKNVIFQNNISCGVIIIYSTFADCRFHDTINDDPYGGVLKIQHSAFTDCLFDDVNVYVYGKSSIAHCYFWNCTYKNVKVVGNIDTDDSFWVGGTMDTLTYDVICFENIDRCEFYNMKMQNMDVGTGLRYNRFENSVFKNVTVRGKNEKNKFFECDTNGLTFEVNMLKAVKEIINKRKKIYLEDYDRIEKCWNVLIEVLSKDEFLTIDILNQLNEEEIEYTSEVFEEIAYNLQSVNYINCLDELYKKFPHSSIKYSIEVAKQCTYK